MRDNSYKSFCKEEMNLSLLQHAYLKVSKQSLKALSSTKIRGELLFFFVLSIFFCTSSLANYTVTAGSNVNATAITGQSGVLTINGQLTISSDVSLLNFTSIIINAPAGRIYWSNNSDLTLALGTTITINSGAPGLQPTTGNGNASQRLIVGTTIISVSSDNANNAAFSFEEFNGLGGLPEFSIAGTTSVCAGSSLALTITPDKTSNISYTYDWSINPSSGTFTNDNTVSLTSASTSITPAPGSYIITVTIKASGNALATEITSVTVNPLATTPSVLASSNSICLGSPASLTATSAGNSIKWYSVASGGTSIGTTASGANYVVSPASSATYYAEAITAAGCKSAARTSVAVAVSSVIPVITGSLSVCAGLTTQLATTATGAGASPWVSASPGIATVNNSGLITGIAAGTSLITYTANSGCTKTETITVNASPTDFSVTGGGTFCAGNSGGVIGLNGSQTGVNYQLQLNNVNTGSTLAGTGAVISFGSQTAAGIYTISASAAGSCTRPMTGNKVIALSLKPTGTISGTQVIFSGGSSSLSLAVTGTGPWNGTLSGGQSFSGNTSPISITVNPATTTSFSIVSLSDANCVADAGGLTGSATISVSAPGEWRGITADWHDGQNWCTGIAPTAGTNITIPVTAHDPVITTGNGLANDLFISNGATLTLNGGNLQVSGSITSTKSLAVIDGTVELTGNTVQFVAGSNFYLNRLKNLTVSNTAGLQVSDELNDSLKISGAIAFGNVNNSTLYTGDNLVLISDANGTASVKDISNNGVNTGNKFDGKVIAQRYFPARRAWRLLTAPLAGAGSIFDNWQNKGVYQTGIGTYISGAGATNPTGSNGLDWSALNNASLKTGSSLSPVSNTRNTLLSRNSSDTADNVAYFIFVRGDRDPANTNPALSNNTTLNSRGKLQTGSQTFPISPVLNGYTLVGNPFASPVDFGKLVRNNVAKRFYVWDPYLNAEQGGYILIDDTDENGTYSITPPSTMNQILQSGQGFFVQTTSNNPASITFLETAKKDGQASLTSFRPVGTEQSFRTNLYNNIAGKSGQLLDGVYVEFDDAFSKEIDLLDAVKFGNVKEMLAIQRNSRTLVMERRPALEMNDTLHLTLTKTNQRSYQLEFIPTGFDASLLVVLEDSYTGTKTILSAVKKTNHDFVITSVAASAASNRFRVVFKKNIAGTVPATFKEIKAIKQAGSVAVDWTVENEINIKSYEVERSVDRIHYSTLSIKTATGINGATTVYQWIDTHPLAGNNYYRVRSVGIDGEYEYSKTVVIKLTANVPGIRIYPNPVTKNIINLEFRNMKAGIYNIMLLNASGQTMLSRQINHVAPTGMESVSPGIKLTPGVYQLVIEKKGDTVHTLKVIVK